MRPPLFPRSLRGRLLATYLVLMLFGLGGAVSWAGLRLQTAAIGQAGRDLALQAHTIADPLADPLEALAERRRSAGSSLQPILEGYARTSGSRLTVLDARLQTLASSESRVPLQVAEDGPELTAAREGRQAWDSRNDRWTGERRLYAAAPISAEGHGPVGYLQASRPVEPIEAEIARTWVSLLLGAGLVLLLTAAVSLVLAGQIATPIARLTAASERFAAGRLDQRVQPGGPDEVRRLGQAFNRMAERLQDTLARQRAFVADAAHELRSPLASLRLRAEMLRDHGKADPELSGRYLARMEQEIRNLGSLVDHLLALASLDEAEHPPRAPLDLAPLLYELADGLGPQVQRAGLNLRVEVPPHLPAIEANAEQVRIVVRNLLDNAIKYTPRGGSVTLSAGPEDGTVRISVSDTGIGIPPEALPHLFERFFRVDKARSRRQGGAGLGLSLVRTIVDTYGGRVDVVSRPEQGSTFTVHLPVEGGRAT